MRSATERPRIRSIHRAPNRPTTARSSRARPDSAARRARARAFAKRRTSEPTRTDLDARMSTRRRASRRCSRRNRARCAPRAAFGVRGRGSDRRTVCPRAAKARSAASRCESQAIGSRARVAGGLEPRTPSASGCSGSNSAPAESSRALAAQRTPRSAPSAHFRAAATANHPSLSSSHARETSRRATPAARATHPPSHRSAWRPHPAAARPNRSETPRRPGPISSLRASHPKDSRSRARLHRFSQGLRQLDSAHMAAAALAHRDPRARRELDQPATIALTAVTTSLTSSSVRPADSGRLTVRRPIDIAIGQSSGFQPKRCW